MDRKNPVLGAVCVLLGFLLAILTSMNAMLGKWPGHSDEKFNLLSFLLDTFGKETTESIWSETGFAIQDIIAYGIALIFIILGFMARKPIEELETESMLPEEVGRKMQGGSVTEVTISEESQRTIERGNVEHKAPAAPARRPSERYLEGEIE